MTGTRSAEIALLDRIANYDHGMDMSLAGLLAEAHDALSAALRERDEAREALKPFADCAASWDWCEPIASGLDIKINGLAQFPREEQAVRLDSVVVTRAHDGQLCVGDFRRARRPRLI